MTREDRTVHARLSGGDLIIRLDRSGKWYRESEGRRFPTSLREAVQLATQPGCIVYMGRPGGRSFDAAIERTK